MFSLVAVVGNSELSQLWDTIAVYLGFDTPLSLLKTVIDVSIVAYVIYKLLILIRDTRAWQLVKGIVFVLLAARISEVLGLKTIQLMLDSTIQYIALAAVVLFQPELRRGLEQIGRSRINGFFGVADNKEVVVSNMVESIVSAAEKLSSTKTGALIVIEGNTKLGDVMDEGTELDSKVSMGLLLNIFEPDTPLHDGAVIIRDTRIKAAACYLPLAKSTFIPKELGTRHRAAIGISEVSDGLAIVVSEETGQISIANDGNLQRGLSKDLLRVKLRKHLNIDPDKAKRSKWKLFKKQEVKPNE